MLGYTRQARRKTFSFFICWRWGHLHLTSSIIETSAGQHGLSISVSMISLHVSSSTFLTTASFCCTAKIDGKCIKEGHPLPLWEFIILNTEGGRDRERCSLGHPFNGGDFFPSSKEGQEECWSGSRVSDTKHNTAFMAGRHLHNAREEKKCTLLYRQLFQYYGNALLKMVN